MLMGRNGSSVGRGLPPVPEESKEKYLNRLSFLEFRSNGLAFLKNAGFLASPTYLGRLSGHKGSNIFNHGKFPVLFIDGGTALGCV